MSKDTDKPKMTKEEMDAIVKATKKHLLGRDTPSEENFLDAVYKATSGTYGESKHHQPLTETRKGFVDGFREGWNDSLYVTQIKRGVKALRAKSKGTAKTEEVKGHIYFTKGYLQGNMCGAGLGFILDFGLSYGLIVAGAYGFSKILDKILL